MFKRLGILALMLAAAGAAVLPTTAFAEDRYYSSRDNYYHSDRDRDRHDTRQSREQERPANGGVRANAGSRIISLIDTNAIPIVRPTLIRIANYNFASDTLFRHPVSGLFLNGQLAVVTNAPPVWQA